MNATSLLPAACGAALVGLIGPAGAGKSTIAAEIARQHPGVVVLSLDAIRAELSPYDDESDQSVTVQTVACLHAELDAALAAGALVVVDATNAVDEHRRALLDIAGRHQAHTVAVVVLPDLETVLARNATRSPQIGSCRWARRVPAAVVAEMHTAITEALPRLPAEGWHVVHQMPDNTSPRRDHA